MAKRVNEESGWIRSSTDGAPLSLAYAYGSPPPSQVCLDAAVKPYIKCKS